METRRHRTQGRIGRPLVQLAGDPPKPWSWLVLLVVGCVLIVVSTLEAVSDYSIYGPEKIAGLFLGAAIVAEGVGNLLYVRNKVFAGLFRLAAFSGVALYLLLLAVDSYHETSPSSLVYAVMAGIVIGVLACRLKAWPPGETED